MMTLDDAESFFRSFIHETHVIWDRANLAVEEPEDAQKLVEGFVPRWYGMSNGPGVARFLSKRTEKQFQRSSDYYKSLKPMELFLVRVHQHPNLGQIFRGYLSRGDPSGFDLLHVVAVLPETGPRIVATELPCDSCDGPGSYEDGRICKSCGGRGWKNAGGYDFKDRGTPVTVYGPQVNLRRIIRPTKPPHVREYERDL